MQLTNKAKKDILNFVLERVSNISDKEYQKRVWIRGEGPECDDFTETVCHFFDDGDPIIENYKDFEITDSQYVLLTKFRDEFRGFSRKYDFPQEFIDTPEWAKIMKLAKEILKAFNYQKNVR